MPSLRTLPPWLLLPAMSLIAVLPLAVHGCSCGHDFDFHLLSWMEAATQFRAGTLHPAWAFSPAWDAGEPRFVFYPPLSWTLGGLLGMALPWTIVPIFYTWLALTAAGAGMYRLARAFTCQRAALVAAALYIANPYMLFTAYERTAYAELLAAAWIPLLLAGVLRRRVAVLPIALPVALMWLTNAPAGVMGCYALAFLAAVRLAWAKFTSQIEFTDGKPTALRFTFRVLGGLALGLALAAFYLLPAAYEQRWVQVGMATISGMRIEDNFLFHHTSDAAHDAVLHTASIIAVILLTVTAAVLGWAAAQARTHRETLAALAAPAIAIAVLLTPLSAPFWQIAPEMNFLQFPWRLLAILAAVTCLAVALAFELHAARWRPLALTVAALAIVAAMALPTAAHFWQECDTEDTVAARLAVFEAKTGTDATDEYTPTNADNDALAHFNPPFWLTHDADAAAPTSTATGPAPLHLRVAAPAAQMLVLNLRDYPAWQIRVNGVAQAARPPRADGLIAVPLPVGVAQVDLSYVPGWDERTGEFITVAAGFIAFGLVVRQRRGNGHPVASRIIVG